MAETKSGIQPFKPLSEFEQDWFKEVYTYLFGEKTDHSKCTVKDLLYKDTYLSRYREYNQLFLGTIGTSSEDDMDNPAFRINDIFLTIAPENIHIAISNRTMDIPVMRSRSSVKLDTGYGEISVGIRVHFTDNPIISPLLTAEHEILYKLIPLIMQLKTIPFCQVENSYLRSKLVDSILETITEDKKDVNIDTIKNQYYNSPLMLTYQSHSMSVSQESNRVVTVDFNFLLFNYFPYAQSISYPSGFVKESGNPYLLKRGTNGNLTPNGQVYYPEDSLPFYEFYAKQFKQKTESNKGFETFSMFQDPDQSLLELHYYDYFGFRSDLIDEKTALAIKNKPDNEIFSDTRGGNSVLASIRPSKNNLAGAREILRAYGDIIREACKIQGKGEINANFVASLIQCESGGNPKAESKDKEGNPIAHGVMQFIPATGEHYGLKTDSDRHDPIKAIPAGVAYMYDLYKLFGNKYEYVAAAYNTGENRKSLKRWYTGKGTFSELPEETQKYVPKVMNLFYALSEKSETWSPGTTSSVTTKTNSQQNLSNATQNNSTSTSPDDIMSLIRSSDGESLPPPKPSRPQYAVYTSEGVPSDELGVITDEERNTIKLIKSLIDLPSAQVFPPEDNQRITYGRVPRKIEIKRNNGIELVGVQAFNQHDVPRIPIAGYQYPTHQYMGGHVEKIILNFIIYNQDGELELQKMLSVINKASANARSYKRFAAFDGIKIIDNSFINYVVGGDIFAHDTTEIQTHPEIPGGSLVAITFTNFTGAYKQAHRVFEFETNAYYSEKNYQSVMMTELLQKRLIRILGFLDYVPGSKSDYSYGTSANQVKWPPKLTMAIAFKPTPDLGSGALMTACDAWNKTVGSFELPEKTLRGDKTTLFSNAYKINNYGDFIDSTEHNKQSIEEYNKDEYNTIKIPEYINIQNLFGSNGTSGRFDSKITSWLTNNSILLYDAKDSTGNYILPKTRATFTQDAKAVHDRITRPAYLDFDLPATIDPDYYFFQPDKYFQFENTKSRKQDSLDKMTNIYKEYSSKYFSDPNISPPEAIRWIDDALRTTYNNIVSISPFAHDTSTNGKEDNYHSVTSAQFDTAYLDRETINSSKDEQDKSNVQLKIKTRGWNVNDPTKLSNDNKKHFKNSAYVNGEKSKQISYYIDDGDTNGIVYNDVSMQNTLDEFRESGLGFEKAFPVCKVFVIEEDQQEFPAPFRDDFDDLFGLNAIVSLQIVSIDDQPADLAIVRFVDMTGKFSSAKYKAKPLQETGKDENVVDTVKENAFKGIILQEGTAVQIRVGYTNNINKLPIVFNGCIVSVESDNNEHVMMCQSYGVETVQVIKAPTKPENPFTWNAETKEILSWCVDQPEMKHFGRWKLNSDSNLQISDEAYGVQAPYYIKICPDGTRQKTWTFTKQEAEANFLAPDEDNWIWRDQWWDKILDDWTEVFNFGNIWTNFAIQNRTIWSIIDELTFRYPGYVARVLPYETRNTIFYGPPDGPYYYRSLNIEEGESLAVAVAKEDKEKIAKITQDIADYNNWIKSLQTALDDVKDIITKANEKIEKDPYHIESHQKVDVQIKVNSYVDVKLRGRLDLNSLASIQGELIKCIKWRDEKLQPSLTAKTQGTSAIRNKSVRNFRQYHLMDSYTNLITNKMQADYRDVYNQIMVTWDGNGISQGEEGKLVTLKMNDFLEEEDIRAKSITGWNADSPDTAYRYGAHQLWREAKKLYKGNIVTIGNPEYKPYDYIVINDDVTQTYGSIEVKQHVLNMSPGEGMISTITPSMISTIRNIVTMTKLDALRYMAAGKHGIERIQANDGWITRNLMREQGLAQGVYTESAIAGVSLLPALAGAGFAIAGAPIVGTITILGSVAMAYAWARLAMTQLLVAKYRNPIILHPVIRQGVPYLLGMNTYRTLGLAAWYREKIHILKDNLESFNTVTKEIPYAGYLGTQYSQYVVDALKWAGEDLYKQ